MGIDFSLYEAKTHLSALVDRAAKGEEIIISKNGVPQAKLVPIPFRGVPRQRINAMEITYIADDFDAPMPEFEELFYGGEIEPST